MAERDTFVDVNDGDQLNKGYFNGLRDDVRLSTSLTTFTAGDNGDATTSAIDSASNQTVTNLTTPAALEDGQRCLVQATLTLNGNTSNAFTGSIFDDTGTALIQEHSWSPSINAPHTMFWAGVVTLTNATDTKSILLRAKRDTSGSFTVFAFSITCTLLAD